MKKEVIMYQLYYTDAGFVRLNPEFKIGWTLTKVKKIGKYFC